MPSGPTAIGISQVDASLIESVDWEQKVEDKSIKTTAGLFAQAHAFDPIIEFSVKGRGASGVAIGASAAGIDAIEGGKTIVTKVMHSFKNDDFDSFEYSGTNYPNA